LRRERMLPITVGAVEDLDGGYAVVLEVMETLGARGLSVVVVVGHACSGM
jgi:hypothetical protein